MAVLVVVTVVVVIARNILRETQIWSRQSEDFEKKMFRFVGERVCDVAFWKEELLAEIQRMESECDNMTVIRFSLLRIFTHLLLSISFPIIPTWGRDGTGSGFLTRDPTRPDGF